MIETEEYEPGNLSPEDLMESMTQELEKISRSMRRPFLSLQTQHEEPGRLSEGLIALADGSDWNPGDGAGFYGYYGSAWVKLEGGGTAAHGVYGVTAGTGNSYTLTLSPALTALAAGVSFVIKVHTDNTNTEPTMNVNGLGAKGLIKYDGGGLANSDMVEDRFYDVFYDGNSLRLRRFAW